MENVETPRNWANRVIEQAHNESLDEEIEQSLETLSHYPVPRLILKEDLPVLLRELEQSAGKSIQQYTRTTARGEKRLFFLLKATSESLRRFNPDPRRIAAADKPMLVVKAFQEKLQEMALAYGHIWDEAKGVWRLPELKSPVKAETAPVSPAQLEQIKVKITDLIQHLPPEYAEKYWQVPLDTTAEQTWFRQHLHEDIDQLKLSPRSQRNKEATEDLTRLLGMIKHLQLPA